MHLYLALHLNNTNPMFNYFKQSFKRKIARRITKEYPPEINVYDLKGFGKVEFANWSNPLVLPITLKSEMIEFFQQFIKEGDFVIDIGANIGDTTVPIALAAGATGLTLGFDPNPFAFKILEKNATLNPALTNIIPVPCAISNTDEEYYFISSEASFGNGAISSTKQSLHGNFVYGNKVKGVILENFLDTNYSEWLPKLSFIKIDAEGYDKEIIKSISGLLSRYKPTIIAECFDKLSDHEKIELFTVISKLGYQLFYFKDFDIHSEVKELSKSTDILRKETFNLYAIQKK